MIEMARPEEKQSLATYIATKIGISADTLVGAMPFEVLVAWRGAKPCGAILYTNYRHPLIEMSCAGEPGWLTRDNVRGMFTYPFVQLQCWTVLALISRSSTRTRDITKRLGFTELCALQSGIRTADAILYGMTRPECKWLGMEEIRNAA